MEIATFLHVAPLSPLLLVLCLTGPPSTRGDSGSSGTSRATAYVAVRNATTGAALCGLDPPSLTVTVRSLIECSNRCASMQAAGGPAGGPEGGGNCSTFNYRAASKTFWRCG